MEAYAPRIRKINDQKLEIWDPLRSMWVALSPEEKVRQYVIYLLGTQYGYPLNLMASEQSLSLGKLHRRADIVVYSKNLSPLMLIECKAPYVPLSQKVLDQVLHYNVSMQVPYLLICNGKHNACYQIDLLREEYRVLEKIPLYKDLIIE